MESTDFCRKSCGTLVTFRIWSSNCSIVRGFCPVHLLLCPTPQKKVTGHEIWTSCRSFVRSSTSQPTSRKLPIFVAIASAASLSHCPHHRRANYKILFRDIYTHYFHYGCFNITKPLAII